MCYSVYLSTTDPTDFSANQGSTFSFEKVDENGFVGEDFMEHSHRWILIGRYGGCSCHFRHFMLGDSVSEGDFAPPEDWRQEDEESIEDTAAFYDWLVERIETGFEVDLVDMWASSEECALCLDVSLSNVGRENFAFFEDVCFRIRR